MISCCQYLIPSRWYRGVYPNSPTMLFSYLLALCLLAVQGMPTCVDLPVNSELLGKGLTESFSCDSFGQQIIVTLKFEKWGIIVSPSFAPALDRNATCPSRIVAAFKKKNRPAMIYYKPSPKPDFFKKIAPAEYRKFKAGKKPNWPCGKVPVQTVHVWRNRKLFVSSIRKAVHDLEQIRGRDCSGPGEKNYTPGVPIPRSFLIKRLNRERLTTTAITYLRTIAFQNYFCV